MTSFAEARVSEIVKKRKGLVKLSVEIAGEQCLAIAYSELTGQIEVGDRVIVNTTASELGLGSGGFHIVVWNMEMTELKNEKKGHIMKLRYTPHQMNCLVVEERDSGRQDLINGQLDISGMPVIVGTLQSQLSPAAAVIKKQTGRDARIAYIMTDKAALPVALSDVVDELINKKVIDDVITTGQAFGGNIETVNIYTALVAAKSIVKADIAIVTMGVGVVGTDTYLGFSGIEQGEIINAVHALKGRPIAIPRLNFNDKRPRHQGLSDQTVAAMSIAALVSCDLPVPRMDPGKMKAVMDKIDRSGLATKHRINIVAADDTLDALDEFDLMPTTMGRSVKDEPEFFRAAGVCGYMAAQMVKDRFK